jgi:hypothetical protein
MYGADGRITGSAWTLVSDATAADARRLANPNKNAAKVATASANPASYVDFTFNAVAGKPYHLWIRGRAEGDVYTNDSVFVQFSGAVTSSGTAAYRIGTTAAADVNLENCSGCGVAGWGWQDNGYGNNVAAAKIYFAQSGTQTLRVQAREDGLSIDQIMLSPTQFMSAAPGALKNDATIYPRANGSQTPPPPPESGGIPAPWNHQDIGSVGAKGTASYDTTTKVFRVTGAGADVWGSADALHYAYRPFTGDGSIVARVASVQNVDAWTKAGVMFRQSLTAGSMHAFMLVSPSKGLAFQRRPTTGGATVNTTGAAAKAPYWVRLDRHGSLITAYQSADGVTWTVVGSDTIAMSATIYVGFGVSSHTTSTTATATFDRVTITGGN